MVKSWSPKFDSLFYQDKTFSVDVKSKDYLDKIAEQANMEVIISATVAKENNNKDNIVKVDNFRLRRADIEIKVSCFTKEIWFHEYTYILFLGVHLGTLVLMRIFDFVDAHKLQEGGGTYSTS